MDQWNRRESLVINPIIYNEEAKNIQWGKDWLFNINDVGKSGQSHAKAHHYLVQYTKNNSTLIKDLK